MIFTFICSIWTELWTYWGSFTIYFCVIFALVLGIISIMLLEKIHDFLHNKSIKKNNQELKKEGDKLDIQHNDKMRNDIIQIADKLSTNILTIEQAKMQAMTRIASVKENVAQQLKPMMHILQDEKLLNQNRVRKNSTF